MALEIIQLKIKANIKSPVRAQPDVGNEADTESPWDLSLKRTSKVGEMLHGSQDDRTDRLNR